MILTELQDYVNTLTAIDVRFITFGREGYNRKNINWNGVVIDQLAMIPTGRTEDFDGTSESLTFTSGYNGTFTLDFYGQESLANASLFVNMQASLLGYEWQRDNAIRISHTNRIINLKILDKNSNQDRYQVELKANFNKSTTISTLRIDTLNPLSLVEGADFIIDK